MLRTVFPFENFVLKNFSIIFILLSVIKKLQIKQIIMTTILLILSMFFIFIPTMIYPLSHKILQNKISYQVALIFAIVLPLMSLYIFNSSLDVTEKINSLISLSPITFLIFYKQFDQIILKRYNRHIYFSMKYSISKESKEATWLEWFFQMLLLFIPFLWIGIGILIFK